MTSALDYIGPSPRTARLRLPPPRRRSRSPQFDAPDQYRVRAELATFFGPRADIYLAVYETMRTEKGYWAAHRSWSWPVFFGSFVWFFYRKMYGAGAMVLFVPMMLSYLVGGSGIGSRVIFAMGAKAWYVNAALTHMAKADRLGLKGSDRYDYLQRAGGVSLPAGLLAGLVYFSVIAILIAAIATRQLHIGH